MRLNPICITGGAGFIGSHLTRLLLDLGYEVRILDNLSTGQRGNVPAGVELIVGDILDRDACAKAIRGCDTVLHLAARVAIRSSFDFVVEDTMTNVSGTASVLSAAAKAGGVRRVVSTSSMAVYSDAATPEPIAETQPTVPISPYGISKLASERLTHNLAAQAGIESVVLRLFNTYGAGQVFSPYVGVVTIFVNQLAQGKQPRIFGDGLQARDFVHVSDVAQAFHHAITAPVDGETFNVGTGVATTVNEVYRAVANAMQISSNALHVDAAAGELRYSIAGISKARAMLGYEPRKQFKAEIATVVADILRRQEVQQ